jgi:hypothetical protein
LGALARTILFEAPIPARWQVKSFRTALTFLSKRIESDTNIRTASINIGFYSNPMGLNSRLHTEYLSGPSRE